MSFKAESTELKNESKKEMNPLNNDGNLQSSEKLKFETNEKSFVGLGKEEVLKYALQPFWVRLRWTLFILFWILWIAMLVCAIVIIVLTPKCKLESKLDWWQKAPIYQIYIRSFKDSNADGIGDLQGITEKLDYIKDLGVKALWVSPFYKSPMLNSGYDISDYLEIDSIFGNGSDFEDLISKMNESDIKLIMDFVPNHSSSTHNWFKRSIARDKNYTDYYIWRDKKNLDNGTSPVPPNNWLSVFGGSAWEWNEERHQFYLHQFHKEQPDLNLRNENNILKYWLDKGVSGFHINAVEYLFEDQDLQNEPHSFDSKAASSDDYKYLKHIYTKDLPEIFPLLTRWHHILDSYEESHKILLTGAYAETEQVVKYYENENSSLADLPINFELLFLTKELSGNELNNSIHTWLDAVPDSKWPNWMLGNHEVSRIGSRLQPELIDAFNMMVLLLPGTAFTYYGEEIGMLDYDNMSNINLTPARTPMQWSADPNAGFTNGIPWLPINPNFKHINVEVENITENSHLNIYKSVVKLRESEAVQHGDLDHPFVSHNIFSFSRIKIGFPGYLFVVNLSTNSTVVNVVKGSIPDTGIMEISSYNYNENGTENSAKKSLNLEKLHLQGWEAMIISIIPKI